MMTGLIIWSVVGPLLTFVAGALAGSADDEDELDSLDRLWWDGRSPWPPDDWPSPANAPRMPGLGLPCELCGKARQPGAWRPGITIGPVSLFEDQAPAIRGWEERR